MTLHELWDFLMPYQRKWLGLFLLFSFLIHLGVFFVFETFPSSTLPRRLYQPRVYFLDFGQTTVGRSNAGWFELLDPRRIAVPIPDRSGIRIEAERLDQQHARVWMQLEETVFEKVFLPMQMALPQQELALRATQSLQKIEVKPMPLLLETPPRLKGTVVQFSAPLSKRTLMRRPELPRPPSTIPLGVTILRIGVNADGIVLIVFIDQSCGDRTVDQLAVQSLRDWRFALAQESIQWSRATIFWDLKAPSNAL